MAESAAELSPPVRRWAIWCHLSGILWAIFVLANAIVASIAGLLVRVLPSGNSSSLETVLMGVIQVLLSLFSLLGVPVVSSVLTCWIVWRIFRDRHPFVDQSGRLALNFQISAALYSIIASVLWAFLVLATCGMMLAGNVDSLSLLLSAALILGGIGALVWMLFQVIVAIVGAMKAWRGQLYKYPFAFNFLGVEAEEEAGIEGGD